MRHSSILNTGQISDTGRCEFASARSFPGFRSAFKRSGAGSVWEIQDASEVLQPFWARLPKWIVAILYGCLILGWCENLRSSSVLDFDTIYDVPRFFAAEMTDNCRVLLFGYELCFGTVITFQFDAAVFYCVYIMAICLYGRYAEWYPSMTIFLMTSIKGLILIFWWWGLIL